jgi:hypothetical protein
LPKRARKPDLLCRRTKRYGGSRRPILERVVSEYGPYAAVIDTYAEPSTLRALILYGPEEQELASFRISDLLTPEEIEEQQTQGLSRRWWSVGVHFDFTMDGRALDVTMRSGRTVRIPLDG